MPMNKTVLGPLLKAKIDALTDEQKRNRDTVFEKLAEAIIEHIQTTAQINGLAAVGLASATGGPVTGTVILPPGSIL